MRECCDGTTPSRELFRVVRIFFELHYNSSKPFNRGGREERGRDPHACTVGKTIQRRGGNDSAKEAGDSNTSIIRSLRAAISEHAVFLRVFLVIHFGNHLLALISTYSESVPISDHQWLKTPLLGHSVAAAPRWVICGCSISSRSTHGGPSFQVTTLSQYKGHIASAARIPSQIRRSTLHADQLRSRSRVSHFGFPPLIKRFRAGSQPRFAP